MVYLFQRDNDDPTTFLFRIEGTPLFQADSDGYIKLTSTVDFEEISLVDFEVIHHYDIL